MAAFLQGLMFGDRCGRRSCVRPYCAVKRPPAFVKSACRAPIRLSSYVALTTPRNVPASGGFPTSRTSALTVSCGSRFSIELLPHKTGCGHPLSSQSGTVVHDRRQLKALQGRAICTTNPGVKPAQHSGGWAARNAATAPAILARF